MGGSTLGRLWVFGCIAAAALLAGFPAAAEPSDLRALVEAARAAGPDAPDLAKMAIAPATSPQLLRQGDIDFKFAVGIDLPIDLQPKTLSTAVTAPAAETGRFAIVLLVNTDKLKVNSVKELIEAAKKSPGAIDYASAGVGSPFHLAGELFAQASGVKITHVPYKGAAPAIQDLVSGQIGMMFVDFATARGQLAMKQIKAIAVASPGAFAGLPGVPPVSADVPGFEAWAWQGFAAPAATPKDAIEKLNAAYVKAVNNAEIKQKLIGAGIDPLQSSPADMAAYIKSEAAKWEKVIKTAGIKLD